MLDILLETERLNLITLNEVNLKMMIDNKLSNYYKWFGDQEVTKYTSHGIFPKTDNEMKEYFNKYENDKNQLIFMIIDKSNKQHIGIISLQNINLINRNAELAVMIGEKDYWNSGYCTEACEVVLKHAFMRLNLHKVYLGTAESNIGMQKVAEKIRMKIKTYKTNHLFIDGKYEACYEYCILQNDYLILRKNKNESN